MPFFDRSTAFKHVSEETKRLCATGGQSRLKPRDPAMYGDHHKCNKCGEQAKYIAKDTHWCKYCLDTEDYPHLAGLSQEERDVIKAENLEKMGKSSIVNVKNMDTPGKIGF